MQRNTIRLIICGILLVMAACASQTLPTLTPTLLPPTSTVVPPTDTPQPPTPTTLPPTATLFAIKPDAIQGIDEWLSQIGKDGEFNGSVLVASKGDVLLSQGYGLADRKQNILNTPQTRYLIASITKQFTAMAILILQSQGELDVRDPICKYIVECPAAWETITIHHLLTHTSGVPNFAPMSELSIQVTPLAPEQIIASFKDLPLDFQPGENWRYGNSGYVILGFIIDQVSDRSYETFLQQSIFTPLNMRDTGYYHHSNGVAVGYSNQYSILPAKVYDYYAAGSLYSTIEDLFKWDQALYTEQLLPQAQFNQMFDSHAVIPGDEELTYGYGWFIQEEGSRRLILHPGGLEGFATMIARYPEDQITIIILMNQANLNPIFIEQIISKKLFGEE